MKMRYVDSLGITLYGPDKNGVVHVKYDTGAEEYMYLGGEPLCLKIVSEYPLQYPTYKRPKAKRIGRCKTRVNRNRV